MSRAKEEKNLIIGLDIGTSKVVATHNAIQALRLKVYLQSKIVYCPDSF